MHMQNFIEICLFILKILNKNAFTTWIKGHSCVVSEWNYPTCNSIPLLSNSNVYAVHMQNSPIAMSMQCICKMLLKFIYSFLRYWAKMHFGHKSRAITLLFLNEIIPLAIQYHSSPIPMSMQRLKKICKKVLSQSTETKRKAFLTYINGHNCCFRTKLSHLQSHTTPLRCQCLCKVWRK